MAAQPCVFFSSLSLYSDTLSSLTLCASNGWQEHQQPGVCSALYHSLALGDTREGERREEEEERKKKGGVGKEWHCGEREKKDKEQGGRKEENLMQTEEGRYGMMK